MAANHLLTTASERRKPAHRVALLFVPILLLGLFLFAHPAKTGASGRDEISRLAKLMDWKPGFVVADIGAGDGTYTWPAAERVGPTGKVFATELDRKKLEDLRSQVASRNLHNIEIVESAVAATNLPPACCDAIFLRRVYHHLTQPAEFDASLVRSLKPGGRLAIIDFPARSELEPVEGVPANRGGHGIPQKVVVEEITAAGLELDKTDANWPAASYCVVFVKK